MPLEAPLQIVATYEILNSVFDWPGKFATKLASSVLRSAEVTPQELPSGLA